MYKNYWKQIPITFLAGFVMLIITSLSIHDRWYKGQIKGYYAEAKKQKKQKKESVRWEQRHGYDYVIPNFIAQQLDTHTQVLLIPSAEYIKKNQLGGNWRDQRWFYYMTEKKIKKVYYPEDSSQWSTANIVLLQTPQGPSLIAIDSVNTLDKILAQF